MQGIYVHYILYYSNNRMRWLLDEKQHTALLIIIILKVCPAANLILISASVDGDWYICSHLSESSTGNGPRVGSSAYQSH